MLAKIMIEFKNVKLNLRNMDVLSDISFKIEKNTVTGFIGNRNAGKSSLMKVLAGIIKSYSGEIFVDEKELSLNKNIKIDIINEKRELCTELSVYEYLLFYADVYGWKKDKALDIFIDSMLKDFSILSYKYTIVEDLEIELYKLVEIIRVMINDPDVILFDNLFSSENIEFNNKLHDFIKSLIGDKTMIFSSRNLNYIDDIVDNIGVLDAGSLIAFGDKETVYSKAELNRKIQVQLLDGVSEAVSILNVDERISNIIYDDNKITFSIIKKDKENNKINFSQIENDILKKLIQNNINVYSFKREQVKFEQLLGAFKD